MLSADQVKGFNKTQIQAFTQQQVAELSVEVLAALTNTQLTAFKVDQLANFTNAQFAWVHDNKLDAGFTKGQLNKINELYAANPPPPPPPTYTLGQAVIDLGEGNGKLIAPVQVEGKWYYFWNRSGTGTMNDEDRTSHDVLDNLFNRDILGVSNSTVANIDNLFGTTNTYRYGTLNGVHLALPTLNGENVSAETVASTGNAYPFTGTAYTDAGPTSNGTTGPFTDIMAIWDAYNGIDSVWYAYGQPPGWGYGGPWTATPGGSGHLLAMWHSGAVWGGDNDASRQLVALQVLPPT